MFVLILLHTADADGYANVYGNVDADVFAGAEVDTDACIVLTLATMLCICLRQF